MSASGVVREDRALFKTPFDCEEEKSAGGVVRFAVGTIWAAVVGVEDPPGLEMPEDSFDGRPQSRDDSVISFISLAERAAGGLLSGSGHAAALEPYSKPHLIAKKKSP